MTVDDLSRKSGVAANTVRYYTRIGLLRPKRHPSNGYKLFDESDITQLRFIREAKALGFSLAEIRRLIEAAKQGAPTCAVARQIVERRVVEIRGQIEELLLLRERMERALIQWEDVPDIVPDSRSIANLIEMVLLAKEESSSKAVTRATGVSMLGVAAHPAP